MRLFSLERNLILNPLQKEDLEVISEEIQHIDIIVSNFLEFSRPPKMKFQHISPTEVVDMTLKLLKHRIESYSIEVHAKRDRKLPEIMVDPEQLKEVLANLLLNACDAIIEGGVIQIQEEEGVMEFLGNVVIIRIKDNGPGIPEFNQDNVFEPFFSTKEEGTGLGLSISKRIIEEHGGRISLQSQENQGATFEIAIPLKKEK